MREDIRQLHCDRLRAYYAKNKDKIAEQRKSRRAQNAAYQKLYYQTTPLEVRQARWRVANAVKRGKLFRPDRCQKCNKRGFTEAHHHLGYAEAHHLDVQWLCKECHSREQIGRPYRPRIDMMINGERITRIVAEPAVRPAKAKIEPKRVFEPSPPFEAAATIDEMILRIGEFYQTKAS